MRPEGPSWWTRAVAALVVAAAVSCGADDDGSAARTTPDTGARERSLAELVGELEDVGCRLDEVDPTEGYDIDEQAACADGSIVLYTFITTRSRDQVVEGITEIPGEFAVVGDLWVAETKTRRDAEAVQAALGGDIES